jgi:glutathione S-transferase
MENLQFHLLHLPQLTCLPARRFLEISPKGKVPAIQNTEDGTVVYESAICDEYLSDLARQMEKDAPAGQKVWKLMPVSASDRAALRLLNDHVDTQLSPAQFTFLMNKDVEKDAEMLESLEKALDLLQDSLIVRGGPYLMGEDFTLADVHVLPFFLRLVVSLKHFKGYAVPKEKFSRLLEWFDLCSARESVKAAAKPDEQIIEVYKRFVEMDYAFGGLNNNK